MPRIFDNISLSLLPALSDTLKISERADFCVGYFNLRGWKQIDHLIDVWPGGDGACCRVIVGMQKLPQDELREGFSLIAGPDGLDQQAALRLKKTAAQEFRAQLTIGAPNDADEAGLRRLSRQLRARKVAVKLFLRHPLHAKLYLVHRTDPNNPSIGFVGSSNLTLAGLSKQGELNVDVLDHDACKKLQMWFEDQWADPWCIDISKDLAEIIDTSWAREEVIPPYHIYLNIAYHLSQEARAGLSEFKVPKDFGNQLLAFQTAAVRIAAHYLNKRNGVVIGDVVGLGKTFMAVALARIFQDDHGTETLIICPKNLISMWQDYVHQYRMAAKVMSISTVINELPDTPRYRLVLIDESHNLRNREGRRYRAIKEYIEKNTSKCILLSATPYNKTYLDLSSQLQLFVAADQDLAIRPERLLKELGETEFVRRHQCPVRSLAAFEKSEYPDDWRDLMRLYLIRRTRSFIKDNYAKTDPKNGRKFLTFESGDRFYFPDRMPKTETFVFDEHDLNDQYARLYSDDVVNAVNGLTLPRYGLGNYIKATPHEPPTEAEGKEIKKLSRAGKRLMGFCRTNLFKRLESGGPAFIQSLERHVLRNFICLHAIENNLSIPIGTQGAEYLDARLGDKDIDDLLTENADDGDDEGEVNANAAAFLRDESTFRRRAGEIYERYSTELKKRFKWLRPSLFVNTLESDLRNDAHALIDVLKKCGSWDAAKDAKLDALQALLTKKYPKAKVLVFTQFADTLNYVTQQLKVRGIAKLEGVSGETENPTVMAYRFSPESNKKRDSVKVDDELRVLVATDVLSEGQNLQDCAVVVNYDLPWAIIRLIQRAGRVDRIGQHSDKIHCHSFLPADGVERIINLRRRVRLRLRQNAEVVGSDETFFEDDMDDKPILDLYNEKSSALEETDSEVDLASYAYQIWKNAIDADPKLQKVIADLPKVVYSTKPHVPTPNQPEGVLVYMRTAEGNDSLTWVNNEGKSVTESQLSILKAAECTVDTTPAPRIPNHHELVEKGVRQMVQEEKSIGGQLGRPSGARFRAYERLKTYSTHIEGSLFATQDLAKAIDQIYRYPLQQSAADALNRQMKLGINDQQLADFVVSLWTQDRLCRVEEQVESQEPQIICSLGLSSKG
ncbi:MAG TPA: helicase-related protein [Candidatus Dormibacteraeota bacterium]|nr:helicase-related protein [Candidatus Dormibacteraeota bacterium]